MLDIVEDAHDHQELELDELLELCADELAEEDAKALDDALDDPPEDDVLLDENAEDEDDSPEDDELDDDFALDAAELVEA